LVETTNKGARKKEKRLEHIEGWIWRRCEFPEHHGNGKKKDKHLLEAGEEAAQKDHRLKNKKSGMIAHVLRSLVGKEVEPS